MEVMLADKLGVWNAKLILLRFLKLFAYLAHPPLETGTWVFVAKTTNEHSFCGFASLSNKNDQMNKTNIEKMQETSTNSP